MNFFARVTYMLALFITCVTSCSAQLQYLLRPVEKSSKKYVELIEQYRNKYSVIDRVENDEAFSIYKKKLEKQEGSALKVEGVYRSREAFMSTFNYHSTEDALKTEISKDLAKVSAGHLYDRKIEANNFKGIFGKREKIPKLKSMYEKNSLQAVSRVQVFMSIPSNEAEFKNIFKEPNSRQLKTTTTFGEKLKSEKNTRVHFPGNTGDLLSGIKNAPENSTLVLIGHNEKGAFRLPDGSDIRFEEIDKQLKDSKRTIVYLSCNANTHTTNAATNFYLTYNDGVALANKINEVAPVIRSDNRVTRQSSTVTLQSIINDYGKYKRQQSKYKIVAYSASLAGAGFVIYEIREDDK